MSRPTPVVQEDATRTAAAIEGLLAALPHENDIAIPSDRERIWHARRTLSGILTSLTSPFEGRLVKLDRRLAERQNWFQHLTACRIDLEKSLAQVGSSNFRLSEDLRESLRLIRDGSEGAHCEVFARSVVNWLAARGFRPDGGGGGFFAAGGLLTTEKDIAELEQERDQIIGQIEASLAYAKQFIGNMAAPVGEVVATN